MHITAEEFSVTRAGTQDGYRLEQGHHKGEEPQRGTTVQGTRMNYTVVKRMSPTGGNLALCRPKDNRHATATRKDDEQF